MATQTSPQNSIINVTFLKLSNVDWILSGRDSPGPGSRGDFISTPMLANWMQYNLPTIGSRPLRHLCIPGSHDSGMSTLDTTGGTVGAKSCNTVTQNVDFSGQLNFGTRYFDLRPVIAGGIMKTGHYSYQEFLSATLGGNGQILSDIINQINAFTASNKELIILNVSHAYNTDHSGPAGHYPDFTQAEWTQFFTQMLAINYRYVTTPAWTDLGSLRLNQFIGGNQAAVLIIINADPVIYLGSFAKQGFYRADQLTTVDQYSNTNDVTTMTNDQLAKLSVNRSTLDAHYFLLSWTLTLSGIDAFTCTDGTRSGILDFAAKAKAVLCQKLFPACTRMMYPNIIYTDAITDSRVAALAMAINYSSYQW